MPLPWTELGVEGWLLLALAGGAAAMDESAWPQAMVSRPLVAATAGGALAGGASDGLLIGIALEILWIPFPPFGAARRPEAGPASVMAGAAFAAAGAGGPVGLLAAILVGWGLGWIGAVTLTWQWGWNARLVPEGTGETSPDDLEARHRWGPPLAFLRGFVVTGSLAVPAVAAVGTAAHAPTAAAAGGIPSNVLGWALAAGLGLAAGAGIRSFGGGRRSLALALAAVAVVALAAGGLVPVGPP